MGGFDTDWDWGFSVLSEINERDASASELSRCFMRLSRFLSRIRCLMSASPRSSLIGIESSVGKEASGESVA